MAKAGPVVTIRLHPQDVMRVAAVLDKAGLFIEGMSLAQAVKTAMSGLLQAAVNGGNIVDEDGFQYDRIVKRFTGVQQGRKRAVTSIIEEFQLGQEVRDQVRARPVGMATPLSNNVQFDTLALRKAKLLNELMPLSVKAESLDQRLTEEEANRGAEIQRELDSIDKQMQGLQL